MNSLRVTCGLTFATFLTATAAPAQDAAPPAAVSLGAAFEVASVRPSNPNPDPGNPLSMVALMLPQPGGRFTAANTPLRMLIYDLVLARSDGHPGPDMRPSKSECSSDEIAAQQGAALAKGDVASFMGKPAPFMVTTDTSDGPLNLWIAVTGRR